MDGSEILEAMGVTRKGVKGAIKGLLDSSPELKSQLREIVGSDEPRYVRVGEFNGEAVYSREF